GNHQISVSYPTKSAIAPAAETSRPNDLRRSGRRARVVVDGRTVVEVIAESPLNALDIAGRERKSVLGCEVTLDGFQIRIKKILVRFGIKVRLKDFAHAGFRPQSIRPLPGKQTCTKDR